MADDFITFLAEKRGKIRKKIKSLQDELSEVDRAEKLFLESRNKPGFAPGATIVETVPTPMVRLLADTITIKAAIRAALKSHPEGLGSGDLLHALRSNGFPNLVRTSLSPQLTRMKGSGELVLKGGFWTLRDTGEGTSSVEDLLS